MRINHAAMAPLLCLPFLLSCAGRSMRVNVVGPPCAVAGPRLTTAWKELNEALESPGGCEKDNGAHCETLRAKITRFTVDCPNDPEVVMANALLAYAARDYTRTQQLLDELFSLRTTYPEAAVLRARLALEEGNVPFAIRFLGEQIQQNGDSSGLRETYASALYAAGRLDEAETQLRAASDLGAPAWRVSYGRGLIAEAKGSFEDARRRYQDALSQKPGWQQPESRIKAMTVSGKITR